MHTLRFFIFNLLGHTLPMTVALVSVPMIAHFAGVERLGALGVVWALVGYFSFLDFGLSRVVTRRVAQAAEQGRLDEELLDLRGFFWWRAVPALAVIGLLLLASRILFAGFLPQGELGRELAASWPWISFSIPVTLATNWLRGALEGVHRFARVNLMRTVFGAWTYAAPAVASLWAPTLEGMIIGIVLGRALALAVHAWACLQAEPAILLGPIRTQLAGQGLFFQEGGWITVSNVIGPLMLYSDRFVLAALVPPTAVAWYVTSQEVLLRTMVIPAALAGVLFPKFAGKPDTRAEAPLAALYQRGIRVIAAIMLPLCALAAAGGYDGLRLWLGQPFAANAYRVVEIVAVGIFVYAIAHLPQAWLQGVGRAHLTAKVQLVELPLYALGLYTAVTAWGIAGAAVLWVLRVFLDCLLLLRLVGQESARPVALPVLIGVSFTGAAGLLSGPDLDWAWRAALCAAAFGGAAAISWFVFLDRDDRRKVTGLLRGRFRVLPKV
ncbi:MAG TPA: oligosaccharide flippase family protein [Noviherbaspirillum sp.]|uniref:oligosaccharide flippase family protein n=1 Tax=Noviherbaspirillum sp. TaxID=1926288 RepID=UPI002D4661FF|nr:oligosaccharide flippase family protein [Noviherbaspirillum sp.]HYD95590.1 oligosaccharide flippase family protein [Noviherbaspirillum sp.]